MKNRNTQGIEISNLRFLPNTSQNQERSSSSSIIFDQAVDYELIVVDYRSFYLEDQYSHFTGEITVPKKQAINPYIEEANQYVIEWLKETGLVTLEKEILSASGANFAKLFSTALLNHSLEDLILQTQFISFLFMLDDVIDKQLPLLKLSQEELDELLRILFLNFERILNGLYKSREEILEILQEIPIVKIFPKYEAFHIAIFDISSKMYKIHDAKISNTEALYHLRNYFSELRTEVRERSSDEPSTIMEYVDMRIETGAVLATFFFIAYIIGLDLEKEMQDDPIKLKICKRAALILSLDNDMASYNKERDEPGHKNFVQISLDDAENQSKKPDNPMQAAFDEAFRYRENAMYGFCRMVRHCIGRDAEKNSHFHKMIAIMKACLRDNMEWQCEVPRYKVNGIGPTFKVKKNSIIKKRIRSNYSEGAVLITSSMPNQDIGKDLVQKLGSLAKLGTLEARKKMMAYLRSIAKLTTKPDFMRTEDAIYLIEQIQTATGLYPQDIAHEFAHVLDAGWLSRLSITAFTGGLVKVASKCQQATKDPSYVKQITTEFREIFRPDDIPQCFLTQSFKDPQNAAFTKNFMENLVPKMLLHVTEDFAEAIGNHELRRKAAGDPFNTLSSIQFDYSKHTITVLKDVTINFYLKFLKIFSANISDVPEVMLQAASAVYKSLEEVIEH